VAVIVLLLIAPLPFSINEPVLPFNARAPPGQVHRAIDVDRAAGVGEGARTGLREAAVQFKMPPVLACSAPWFTSCSRSPSACCHCWPAASLGSSNWRRSRKSFAPPRRPRWSLIEQTVVAVLALTEP